ncbi:MAG: sulfonate ABC transporter permease [Polyangiaceae bacterium UTPRO1]|nr:MAG: sulfonate ABC transporter permease [Polyangiaceae bacterium UTPRO1]
MHRRFPPLPVWLTRPNRWDLVAAALVFGGLASVIVAAREMRVSLEILDATPIALDPAALPGYAARTTLRTFAALALSLTFTFAIATLAAKSRRAEKILIPLLDILQSVPVLGYLSFTVVLFLGLFPGSVLGAELAAIFAIFTSQVWNMTFSLYQSLRTVPHDMEEAAVAFHLSAWQRFWRLEVPFAVPGLVWNMMMSMSGGWFFVVAAEAITVGTHTIDLPGIGSYVALAIAERDLAAVGAALVAMLVVIALYDQLMFRPLVAWADKFRMGETAAAEAPRSWLLTLLRRTRLVRSTGTSLRRRVHAIAMWRPAWRAVGVPLSRAARTRIADLLYYGTLTVVALAGAGLAVALASGIGTAEILHVLRLGLFTLLRVAALMAVALVVWVPLGVLIGLRPRLAERLQPAAQFLAAFPANLLFPLAVVGIVHFKLDPDIWLSPLMLLGAQWYILFNVIAGASAVPNDLVEAARSLHVRGWLWWRKVMLPGVFPYVVTGALTAWGGAWNASIVAEAVRWGDTHLVAQGLGAYITLHTEAGDQARVALGVIVMCLFVVILNRLLWRPLYDTAARRFQLR